MLLFFYHIITILVFRGEQSRFPTLENGFGEARSPKIHLNCFFPSSTYYFVFFFFRVQSFKFSDTFTYNSFSTVSDTNTFRILNSVFFLFLVSQYIDTGLMLFKLEATEKRALACVGCGEIKRRQKYVSRERCVYVGSFLLLIRSKQRERKCKIIDPVRPWLMCLLRSGNTTFIERKKKSKMATPFQLSLKLFIKLFPSEH